MITVFLLCISDSIVLINGYFALISDLLLCFFGGAAGPDFSGVIANLPLKLNWLFFAQTGCLGDDNI